MDAASTGAPAPALTEVQKLTLRDKLRDANEAARLATPDVIAKEIAAFMMARVKDVQDKHTALNDYYQSLPRVDGYVLSQDGEYVKTK